MNPTQVLLIHPFAEPMTSEIISALKAFGSDILLTSANTADEAISVAGKAEVLMAFYATRHLLDAAPNLRWIQALGSGVDGFARHSNLPKDVIITSAAGIHAKPVSEAALSMMFALGRQLPRSIRAQQSRRWGAWIPQLISGSEVVIIGVGHIGAEIGAKCAALGANVVGISERADLPPGFKALYPRSDLHERLTTADFVVITAPHTPATSKMFGAAAFSQMKPSAYLVNVARGTLVDDDALIDALQSGRIAGAALDVFTTEPLPADSPYWDLPNVIVTPHRAGYHAGYGSDVSTIIVENLGRYRRGQICDLINRQR